MTSSSESWETDDWSAHLPIRAAPEALPLLAVPDYVSRSGDKLCDTCEALQLSPRRFVVLPGDKEWGKPNQPDKSNIRLGKVEDMKKKLSCPMCRLVLVALGGEGVPTDEDGEPVEVRMSWNTDGPTPDPAAPWSHIPEVRVLRPYMYKQSGDFVSKRLNLFPSITLLANDSPTDSTAYFIRPIRQDMIDFAMVRRWLSICRSQHGRKCRRNPVLRLLGRTHPAGELPSFRCIDVEQDCLVMPPPGCCYAALSYVWGKEKFFSTLTSNVKCLEEPQALSKPAYRDKIPPTIQDAIQVAKEIQMKYLWVDNLCIIQDDNELKTESIKMMDLVYSAADLVIVAAGSENAYSGIEGVRPNGRVLRQPIEEIGPGFRLAFRSRYADSIQHTGYSARGWTFQEGHFALRSLVFVDGQVAFRCEGNDAWEAHVFEPLHEVTGPSGKARPYENDDIGTYEGLIQGYSERLLSYETDVYNAFAGIGRETMCRLDTDMCHGIPTIYFDWFLLWGPLAEHTRRLSEETGLAIGPSWSWSGWIGCSWPHMWDWYTRSIKRIRKAIRKRTWIIWYQRERHGSTHCTALVRHHDVKEASASVKKANRNYYGSRIRHRFDNLDCSRVEPTDLTLTDMNPPTYVVDISSNHSGSGFLQFWTVSLTLRLAEPTSPDTYRGPPHKRTRLGIFGRSGRELGTLTVQPSWLEANILPQEREFILLCEGRDERAENGKADHEEGWRYKAMLVEWRDGDGKKLAAGSIGGDGKSPSMYAERVAIGSIGKADLNEAFGDGPVWKEIILG
ncbi:heterokaryon incompatibility protein-domain-containing protein [Hypoxylon argillaceum]|nr:heterokaryon incompatibility protein-domain-containing protein [Hypoxylon argillaceum]